MNGTTILVICFLGIFALVLIAVSAGWGFMETQRKKKVVGMLDVVSGKAVEVETTVLKDAPGSGPDALSRLLESFNLSAKIQAQLQQAGLEWTLGKLLLMMGAFALVGAVVGIRFKPLLIPW